MAHDFKAFPELTNSQMDFYYADSPHVQIFTDFEATVVKVHDGDTITVRWHERDFDFPVRLIGIDAPEMNAGGLESKLWLEKQILNQKVEILIDKNQRVGKWGRILGQVFHNGMNINQESLMEGMSVPFDRRREGTIPDINAEMAAWL